MLHIHTEDYPMDNTETQMQIRIELSSDFEPMLIPRFQSLH